MEYRGDMDYTFTDSNYSPVTRYGGFWAYGTLSIKSDNLKSENIRKDVTILGVKGSYSGNDGGTAILGTGSVNSNITWTVLSDGRLIIEGTGATPDYSSYVGTPWYNASIITEITQIYISNGISTIGTYIFSNLPNVT